MNTKLFQIEKYGGGGRWGMGQKFSEIIITVTENLKT